MLTSDLQDIMLTGYTNGGDRVNPPKGGKANKNWIQSVNKSIKKRGFKGRGTPVYKQKVALEEQ